MARFQAFLQLGPRGQVSERWLGEVEADNAAKALMLAKSAFAYGQAYCRTRIVVRGGLVEVQPPARPSAVQSFAGAGLFLALALPLIIAFAGGN